MRNRSNGKKNVGAMKELNGKIKRITTSATTATTATTATKNKNRLFF
jgi:hypothetical protein